jgi:hypothetical protein
VDDRFNYEFLRWFDTKVRGQKVLLLLDYFSGHELGIQLVGGLDGLINVKIQWLPANTTSHWQPLDQGIIASFQFNTGDNGLPICSVNLRQIRT